MNWQKVIESLRRDAKEALRQADLCGRGQEVSGVSLLSVAATFQGFAEALEAGLEGASLNKKVSTRGISPLSLNKESK